MDDAAMTGSATKQPYVAMDTSLTRSATEQPTQLALPYPAGPPGAIASWEIHVAFNNDKWWVMPQRLSDPILHEWLNGSWQVSFIWDWQNSRRGAYRPDGADTTISRYMIDFEQMRQRNIDNDRTRKIKDVSVIR